MITWSRSVQPWQPGRFGSSLVKNFVPAVAVRESERANPGMPVVQVVSREIVGPSVPERTIINRINRHLTVVSEAGVVWSKLDATAVDQRHLATRQGA